MPIFNNLIAFWVARDTRHAARRAPRARTQIRAARHSRPAEREGAVSQAEVAATRAELEEAKLASLFEGLGCGDDAPGIGD